MIHVPHTKEIFTIPKFKQILFYLQRKYRMIEQEDNNHEYQNNNEHFPAQFFEYK